MFQHQKILAIIPARGGSKGIPGKNLKKINGVSLLGRAIQTAQQSNYIDRLIVSSDDEQIIAEAKRFNADVPFTRPAKIAQDTTSGLDPVLHALDQLPGYDVVVLLQVTSPFRIVEDIDGCIAFCFEQKAPFCVSVCESRTHPQWCYQVDEQNHLHPLLTQPLATRRQDLDLVMTLNGAVYVAQTDALQREKMFLTERTVAYPMPVERSLDIDTPFDLQVAQALAATESIYSV